MLGGRGQGCCRRAARGWSLFLGGGTRVSRGTKSLASGWSGSPGEQQLMELSLGQETVLGREACRLLRAPRGLQLEAW